MAQKQTQAFCRSCNRHTLHTRIFNTAPHGFHFLVMLLLLIGSCFLPLLLVLFALWFVIWIVHSLVVEIPAYTEPYRCSQCGSAIGGLTPEELEERQAAREETMRAVGRGVGHAVHIFLVVLVWLVKRLIAWARTVPPFLAALPGRCDRYLAIGAGEGNDILHWFLRIFSATIAVVVFVGIVMFGIRSVKSIFQPQPQAEVAVSHNDGLQPNEDLQPAESVSPPPATTPVAMPAMPIPSNPPDIRPAVPQSIDRPIERPQPATDKPTISEDTFAGESEQAFQEMVNASVRKTNKLWLSCY